ncbi:MAG: EVE domain-containing protein [Acidobacteria bacterium]|nr:MAG: EVE domain-containing protein [Acidobacteriota bacterium]
MAYWLLKTEPTAYSYANLERDQKTVWDGVTNNLALKYLRSMRKGDLAFIYHTGDEKSLIGIAEVASDPYPDPKKKDSKLAVVELKPKERLPRALPLSEIKAQSQLKNFELVRLPRLSVMPVSDSVWKLLLEFAKKS